MKSNESIKYDSSIKVVRSFYSVVLKRILDIFLSSLALIILSPLLIVICILELLIHGRPILYKTKRPGKDAKVFNMYKFRSMTNEKDCNGILLPENKRITNFGYFLRKTSIDELPSLWSIIKGDMSIIGPRPLLIEYTNLYSPRHATRLCVRPGLACAIINPDNPDVLTWRAQFDNDVYYVEHISFITDIRVLFAIVKEVFHSSAFRANDTRVPFNGTNLDETRSKQELGIESSFESVQGNGIKK